MFATVLEFYFMTILFAIQKHFDVQMYKRVWWFLTLAVCELKLDSSSSKKWVQQWLTFPHQNARECHCLDAERFILRLQPFFSFPFSEASGDRSWNTIASAADRSKRVRVEVTLEGFIHERNL